MTLSEIIQYAYDNAVFWHELLDQVGIKPENVLDIKDLLRLPILRKIDLQMHLEQCISDEYKRYPKNQFVQIRRTSGSTGRYLRVYWDRRDDLRSLLPLWKLRKAWYGIYPNDKLVSYYSTLYNGNKIVPANGTVSHYMGQELTFCKTGLTDARLFEDYRQIEAYNPTWHRLQPSIAFLLAKTAIENHFKPWANLKYIELTGEMLRQDTLDEIRRAFPVPVANMYGMNEVNTIALSCPEGTMHVLGSNLIVEVINTAGKSVLDEEGDIVVTSLTNRAMPIIRYETGDRGVLSCSECPCGHNGMTLKLSAGRNTEFVRLPDGSQRNAYVLYGAIEYTNEYMAGAIGQYQIQQLGTKEFRALLCLKPAFQGWRESASRAFLDNLSEPQLREATWHFDFPDSLFPDETGKVRAFVSMPES